MNSDARAQFRKCQATVREALLHEWDPIGVAEFPQARDEYDSYIPAICKMLIAGKGAPELFDYLWKIETESMGLPGDRAATERFADRLSRLSRELEPG